MFGLTPGKSAAGLDAQFVKTLYKIFSSERVSTEPVDCLTYSYDATKKEYPPQAVVWPTTAHEIANLLKAANEYKVPLYPRGGGTGLTGGALATHGGILVSMERMAEVLELDEENRLITAQPGIPLGELKSLVQEKGLFYPPDPSSAKSASLGGTLAECAGGLNCVKYGTTKDWVQSIEAVLPTGEIIHVGTKARKSVVGYNLLQLIIGSEGTLAFITKATLRLIPYPEHRETFIALFDTVKDSSYAVRSILSSGVVPCALEFIDRKCLEAGNEYAQKHTIPIAEALLIVECDGYNKSDVEKDLEVLMQSCREQGATSIQQAHNEQERINLWAIRKTLSPAMYTKAPFKTNEDVCVPIASYPDLMERAYEISQKHNVLTLCFGHAGDGNIHVNFMSHKEKDPDVEVAVHELFQSVVDMGGSISGEHGIGIMKLPYLHLELGERERQLLKDIKYLFDPNLILNPEKIIA